MFAGSRQQPACVLSEVGKKEQCHIEWDLAIAHGCPDVTTVIFCPYQVQKKSFLR